MNTITTKTQSVINWENCFEHFLQTTKNFMEKSNKQKEILNDKSKELNVENKSITSKIIEVDNRFQLLIEFLLKLQKTKGLSNPNEPIIKQPFGRTLFESTLRAVQSIIVSHNVSVNCIKRTIGHLKTKYNKNYEKEEITPEIIKNLSDEQLKDCLSWNKIKLSGALKKLCDLFIEKKITPENLNEIIKIKWIGDWTYKTALILYLLNPRDDIFSIEFLKKHLIKCPKKDVAIRKGYCKIMRKDVLDVEYKEVENFVDQYDYLVPYIVQIFWQASNESLNMHELFKEEGYEVKLSDKRKSSDGVKKTKKKHTLKKIKHLKKNKKSEDKIKNEIKNNTKKKDNIPSKKKIKDKSKKVDKNDKDLKKKRKREDEKNDKSKSNKIKKSRIVAKK